MHITVVTLFPEMLEGFFKNSIMSRAVKKGLITYDFVNFRDYALDVHHTCDDVPYGGGAGMLLKAEPICKALEALSAHDKHVIFPSPSGKRFTQDDAKRLSSESEIIFVCGHYEGVDQRVIDTYVDEEFSIGDYVISSGEVSTLVMIDAIYRLIDGVITSESLDEESFTSQLLEYPQYTRPETYCNKSVPCVLLSGHHAKVATWREIRRLNKTMQNRPELLSCASLDTTSRRLLIELLGNKGTDQNGCDQSD